MSEGTRRTVRRASVTAGCPLARPAVSVEYSRPMAKLAIDVKQLSPDERLDLIEQLWDSLSDEERSALPLTTEQERELDRRLDVLDRKGPSGINGDELRARLRRQST